MSNSTHSESARKIVLAKGLFDVFLSLSLIFAPALLYDGPVPLMITKKTGLPTPNWTRSPGSAYGLAALCMGAAFAGIKAGRSYSNEAYQTVATLNGVFAMMGLIGCYFLPNTFGSSFLLIASLQDVFWFSAIIIAGRFNVMDTLIGQNIQVMERAKAQARKKAQQGIEWSQENAGQVKKQGQSTMQRGEENIAYVQEKGRQGAIWGQGLAQQGWEKGQEVISNTQDQVQQGKEKGRETVQSKAQQGREMARNTENTAQKEEEFREEHEPIPGVSYATIARQ